MDKNTIIRLLVLLFTLTNLILTACGVNPLPFSEASWYELVSIAVTLAASAWSAWKNNNITPEAQTAQKVLDEIKKGNLKSEDVEKLIAKGVKV